MRHFEVKIIDASGTRIWNIIAARSVDAGRTVLRLATIDGPFFMVTRLAT